MMKIKNINLILALALFAFGSCAESKQFGMPLNRAPMDSFAINKVAATGYVTWWSHDATGYHPMILLRVKNVSKNDLSGQKIRFQCKFTDLDSGIIRTGRAFIQQSFRLNKDIFVLLKNPQPYDLTIDDNNWPKIECKVMCRAGDGGDEITQTLLTVRLDNIAMTEDDALEKISRMPDFSARAEQVSTNRQASIK